MTTPLNDGRVPGAPRVTVNRWSAWAESLAGRHARRARFVPLPLTLVLAVPVGTAAAERSINQLWNVCLRARLALGPVLVSLGWKVFAGPLRTLERVSRQAAPLGKVLGRTAAPDQREPSGVLNALPRLVVRPTRPDPNALPGFERLPPLPGRPDRQRASRASVAPLRVFTRVPWSPAALERVFTRLTDAQQAPQARPGQGTLMQRTREIVERVQSRRERLAEARPGPRLLHAATTRKGAAEGEESRRSDNGAAPTSCIVHAAADQPAALDKMRAALDVDGLADQVIRKIDDRVTALRERFGRAF